MKKTVASKFVTSNPPPALKDIDIGATAAQVDIAPVPDDEDDYDELDQTTIVTESIDIEEDDLEKKDIILFAD